MLSPRPRLACLVRFVGPLALLAGLLAFVGPLARAQAPAAREPAVLELASYPRSTLQIAAASGTHAFEVWLADTPERQRQGLMYVRDLPANQGMLFVNEAPRVSSFWMKNTYIPLDMLFIDARGRIVAIFADTRPLSLDPVGPTQPVLAVLELRGGESARRGIREGDRVKHAVFGAP